MPRIMRWKQKMGVRSLKRRSGSVVVVAALLIVFGLWVNFNSNISTTTTTTISRSSTVSKMQEYRIISFPSNSKNCAAHKGVIVVDMMGLMGNNIFEVGFANRMATELCWDIVYRQAWIAHFLEDPYQRCFPNAMLGTSTNQPNSLIDNIGNPKSGEDLMNWKASLQKANLVELCPDKDGFCDYTGAGINRTLQELRTETSSVRVWHLKTFFIHGQWVQLEEWRNKMRHWFGVDPSCCRTPPPPDDAVVIHIRDFESVNDPGKAAEHASRTVEPSVYKDLLKHYDLENRPIWIVCQPKSVDSRMVASLALMFPNAHVHTGQDQFDAFCILQKAKTMVISYASTFSQAAALSGDPSVQVHFPIVHKDFPQVSIDIQEWKYHLVDPDKTGLSEFDVPNDQFNWRME